MNLEEAKAIVRDYGNCDREGEARHTVLLALEEAEAERDGAWAALRHAARQEDALRDALRQMLDDAEALILNGEPMPDNGNLDREGWHEIADRIGKTRGRFGLQPKEAYIGICPSATSRA